MPLDSFFLLQIFTQIFSNYEESMSKHLLPRRVIFALLVVTFVLVVLIFARVVVQWSVAKELVSIYFSSLMCSWNLFLRILFCSAGNSYAGYNEDETFASEQGGLSDDQTIPIVQESSTYTNYQTYMNKTPRSRWSKQDTELFYEVTLAVVNIVFTIFFFFENHLFWGIVSEVKEKLISKIKTSLFPCMLEL